MKHLYEPQPERPVTNHLSLHDVGFITALAQDVSVTEKNIAAIESGFFSAQNCDWMESEQEKLKALEQIHYLRTLESAKLGREAQGEALKRLGSSKGAKVGHGKRKQIERFITRNRRLKPRHKTISYCGDNVTDEYRARPESQTGWIRNEHNRLEWQPVGTSRAYLMRRDWAQQIKMQVKYHPSPSDAPAPQTGERFTERLTPRAVKKIFESGAYVAACRGGFNTFLTLTFDDFERAKLFATDSNVHLTSQGCEFTPLSDDMAPYSPLQITIGGEASRFLDGVKRMFHRGFSYQQSHLSGQANLPLEGDEVRVSGHYKPVPLMGKKKQVELCGPAKPLSSKRWEAKPIWGCESQIELVGPARGKADFHYIWVAECPTNEHGQPNPHVHILLNWQVEPEHFQAWAKRIERLWGHGIAHLEKIKFNEAAAGYLIKAVGYAAKGDNADQGLIKGNRYNIARCSRAPDWEVLRSFEVDNMTGIIKECGYMLEQWRKPMQREIKRKEIKKQEAIRAIDINRKKAKFDAVQKLNHLIKKLDYEARQIRERLKSRGAFASSQNQFSIVFEGEEVKRKAGSFLYWAHGARGWSMKAVDEPNDDDLNAVREEAKDLHAADFERFQVQQANWKSLLSQDIPPDLDFQTIKSNNMSDYLDYCHHTH